MACPLGDLAGGSQFGAVLYVQNKGFRYIEALVITLILTIGGCFFAEILFSKPDMVAVAGGLLPTFEIVRHYGDLRLAESDEMKADRDYLLQQAAALVAQGLQVRIHLALGNPPTEILMAAEQQCDLIAMATHGHRFLGDLLHGSTISAVRHKSPIPLLLVRAAVV